MVRGVEIGDCGVDEMRRLSLDSQVDRSGWISMVKLCRTARRLTLTTTSLLVLTLRDLLVFIVC